MGKATTYLAVISVIIIGFHFAGLIQDTPISWFMAALLEPQNLHNNSFFTELEGILALFAGAGIVIGSILSSKIEQGATIAFTSLLFIIGWDMLAIYGILRQTNEMLAIILISPFLTIYLLSVIEWWRGKD
jgi:hypothetical protein